MMKKAKCYRFLGILMVLNIVFQLVSDVTAGKIVILFGIGVSVTVLYFPFTYIISDVLTEVYGYSVARTILWYTLFASMLAGLLYQICVVITPAPFFENAHSYDTVFGIMPRVLVGSWLAVYTGDISNNYTLAKLKVFAQGRHLWIRTITSTVVGQGLNTLVFYLVALWGVIPFNALLSGIVGAWIMKTIIEALMTPFTYLVVKWLKKTEGVDYYDNDTNFNPFIVGII